MGFCGLGLGGYFACGTSSVFCPSFYKHSVQLSLLVNGSNLPQNKTNKRCCKSAAFAISILCSHSSSLFFWDASFEP